MKFSNLQVYILLEDRISNVRCNKNLDGANITVPMVLFWKNMVCLNMVWDFYMFALRKSFWRKHKKKRTKMILSSTISEDGVLLENGISDVYVGRILYSTLHRQMVFHFYEYEDALLGSAYK